MKPRSPLSPRQKQILWRACSGECDKQIASALKISEGTVKNHFSKIFVRLKAKSRTHAAAIFVRSAYVLKVTLPEI